MPFAVVLSILAVIAISAGAAAWSHRRRSMELVTASTDLGRSEGIAAPEAAGRLTYWLSLAGYRNRRAASAFAGWTAAGLVLGMACVIVLRQSGLLEWMVRALAVIPGGLGEVFALIVRSGPWILLAILTCAPLLIVRAARRQRVLEVEQDLPLMLELFATLAEAGLGFDAALSKVLESQPAQRPLAAEFRTFQHELRAGVPRIQSLRRLACRLEVTSVTVFVSALVQAEQIGASIAETLRRQSEDVRDRRRERALLLAQALPVKLFFPLVLCFLPGILLSTLGPALYQLIRVSERFIGR